MAFTDLIKKLLSQGTGQGGPVDTRTRPGRATPYTTRGQYGADQWTDIPGYYRIPVNDRNKTYGRLPRDTFADTPLTDEELQRLFQRMGGDNNTLDSYRRRSFRPRDGQSGPTYNREGNGDEWGDIPARPIDPRTIHPGDDTSRGARIDVSALRNLLASRGNSRIRIR